EAVSHYNKASELGLATPALFNNRGKARMDKGEMNEALADFSKAIEMDPDFIVACRNRAQIYIRNKDWEKALKDLNRICEDGDGEDLFQRAEVRMKQEDWSGAAADLQKAASVGIESVRINPPLASCYFNADDFTNAAKYFEKVVQHDASALDAWQGLGISLYMDEKYEQSEQALSKAIERGNSSKEAFGYRGMSLYRLGKNDKAFEDLSRVSTMGFTHEDAYYFLGNLLLDDNKYETAVVQFNKAIALEPEKCGALASRAMAYSALSEHENAIRDISKAISIEDSPELRKTSGRIQYMAKNYQKAIELSA
ncbi:MAG: tetratricopeptide repeat protein, partial [Cyclobacteriaceae bacterium]